MYTIKQAAELTGVPVSSLRAWERRYDVVHPARTESGYRLYDDDAVAALSRMRALVESGWAPTEAARAVREERRPAPVAIPGPPTEPTREDTQAEVDAPLLLVRFLRAAAAMDLPGIESALDHAFALGSFEHVADTWLMPALQALGEGWERGEIDVAGEHAASHAVLRRLSASFEAAAHSLRGPRVVVGLPAGGQHELGALSFATTLKRRGVNVLYLGANVPAGSWTHAVARHDAAAAVLAVPMSGDRPAAIATVRALRAERPDLLIASGGGHGDHLGAGSTALPDRLTDAAARLDALLHDET